MTKCYECGKGKLIGQKVDYKKYGVLIGKYSAEVCDKCGEILFESDAVGKIEKK